MYFGDIPSSMKAFSVGVRPLLRKSALNPSRDMSNVVGGNSAVPLDSRVAGRIGLRPDAR
jgi:hypothetical protein